MSSDFLAGAFLKVHAGRTEFAAESSDSLEGVRKLQIALSSYHELSSNSVEATKLSTKPTRSRRSIAEPAASIAQ